MKYTFLKRLSLIKRNWNILSIILFLIIPIFLFSCKTHTIQEFTEKYDAIEVVGEITHHTLSGGSIFDLKYNDSTYEVYLASPPYLAMGTKYWILIDKNNPHKHNLVLLHKQVIVDSVPLNTGQILITDVYKGKNEIWVYYNNIEIEIDLLQNNKTVVFYEDIKYFELIQRYMDLKSKVIVDIFITEQLSDGRAMVTYKINYQKTNELNKL